MTLGQRPTSAIEDLVAQSRRQLFVDPTSALRTLDVLGSTPSRESDRGLFDEALSIRVVASSMLGLNSRAESAARQLGMGSPSHASLATLADWVLLYAGDRARLASPVAGTGCGRQDCGHGKDIEVALRAVRMAGDPERRRQVAHGYTELRPEVAAFRFAEGKALVDQGRLDEAVAYFEALGGSRYREAAGLVLYTAGRFEEAASRLDGLGELQAASRLAADLQQGGRGDPRLRADLMGWPMLAAIHHEAAGRWQEASRSWTGAGRPLEAWEASLMAGDPVEPMAGGEPRWDWRYYALTGKSEPTVPPAGDNERRYGVIGRTRETIARIRMGKASRSDLNDGDPFLVAPVVALVEATLADPLSGRRYLDSFAPPERPRYLGRLLNGGASDVPSSSSVTWDDWAESHPAVPLPVPGAQRLTLAKALQSSAAMTDSQLDDLIADQPVGVVVTAAGVALAKGWPITGDLAARLVAPATIASCLGGSRADLLATSALVAGTREIPDDVRVTAGEVAGALVALAEARGELSESGARQAVAVIELGLSEVAPSDSILGPVSAYEHERAWTDGRQSIMAGPILASRAGLDAEAAGVPMGTRRRMYGPLGRARILADSGHLDAALRLATDADSSPARDEFVRETQRSLAIRLAATGEFERAVELAIAAAPDGAPASSVVAKEIVDRLDGDDLGPAIAQLERLYTTYPGDDQTRVALADLLNRRAVAALNADRPLAQAMGDLTRALKLDPDDIAIRRNAAMAYFRRAAEAYERDPLRALDDLRAAYAIDPNNGQLREVGANVAMASGIRLMERKRPAEAFEAVRLALELDPNNEPARRARAMMMYR